jgi:hypothetical protein
MGDLGEANDWQLMRACPATLLRGGPSYPVLVRQLVAFRGVGRASKRDARLGGALCAYHSS